VFVYRKRSNDHRHGRKKGYCFLQASLRVRYKSQYLIRSKNKKLGHISSHFIPPHLGSLNGSPPCRSPTTHPGAYSLPVLIRCPSSPLSESCQFAPAPAPPTMIFGAPLILAGLAECTLAVSEYISLVTLAALLIVPARLMSGLAGVGPWPLRLELGEREMAV
jgi:hypothetical protein